MLASTLIAILPLLVLSPASARTHHPNTRGNHERAIRAASEHALNLARSQESRREANLSSRDSGRRKIKARGCNAQVVASAASAVASSVAPSAATSNSAVVAVADYAKAKTTTAAAVTTTSSAAAAVATTSTMTTTSSSSSSLTPNGIKAGVSAGDAVEALGSHIGWWYDWSANPSGHSTSALAIPMLWGDGAVDSQDASRLAAFKAITSAPKYIIGFEEPDCTTYGSSDIGVAAAALLWDTLIAPWGAAGSILLSPSMCHQADETYLTPFSQAITRQWDVTNLHINKNSMAGVQKDLDYYWNTYKKPMWITEFACVDDSNGFTPCTDQTQINQFINDIVALFEADSRVYAYAYSNGEGLGDTWPMWSGSALTQSGQTYLNAISKYH